MVLRVHDMTVRYGSAIAVSSVSITAESGSVTAVVGPNGAGKSSLFSAVFGAVRSTGTVHLETVDLSRTSAMSRGRRGFAYVPQGRQLFMKMSVVENLVVGADLLGAPRSAVDSAMDRFPVLRERAGRYAGVLSGGEQQMLVLARALLAEPKVLLLDEMTTGLAPKIVAGLRETVRDLAASGVAVLIAEPALTALKSIVDRGYVMQRGRVVADCASADELDRQYRRSMGVTEASIDAALHE
ncbi:ABC transporter ATP-binding protein [Prescottella equi]|uniref:ABC transporter ATP-binding protein n=1 Tax=Rhodococcus hoagii TaxID=43767 RepID=UPI000A7236EB|nr:ATP-binding cassette domain-containing protein [Prescottella equi]BCN51704.1 ABC transporter ATP-binding protein [Prescottella equi]BCN76423.1 ABC transporter ATP-binding protein [Prescottella equi]BDE57068.1 ABC transporter ATP-binding protein [Prescottella equi]